MRLSSCCPIEWAVSNDSRKKDGRDDGKKKGMAVREFVGEMSRAQGQIAFGPIHFPCLDIRHFPSPRSYLSIEEHSSRTTKTLLWYTLPYLDTDKTEQQNCMNHTDGRRFPRLPGTVPRDNISLQTSICLSSFFVLFSSKALTISHLELVLPVGITICRATICPPITRTSFTGSSTSSHSCSTFISIAVLGVPRPIMYMVLLLVQLLAGTTLAAIILTPLGHIIVSSSRRRVCVGCSG